MSKSPSYDPLRPIGARALKSARDTLRPYLAEARVLDLYGGQGRFGIAALDEAAANVVFVELHQRTAADLRKLLSRYTDRSRVVTADVFVFLADDDKRYDIIFADPPFPEWKKTFEENLFSAALFHLEKEGIFLVKHPSRVLLSDCPKGFERWKSVVFGESTLAYFRYAEK